MFREDSHQTPTTLEFICEFLKEFFTNFMHECKCEIRTNSYEFFAQKIDYVTNDLYCTCKVQSFYDIWFKFCDKFCSLYLVIDFLHTLVVQHMGAPAQKSVIGDTNAKNFWKLYAGKFLETICWEIFGKYMLGNFLKTICWEIFWKLYAGKFCDPYEGNLLMEKF